MKPLGAATFGHPVQPRSQSVVSAWPGEETARERTVVKARASDDDRQAAAPMDLPNARGGIARKLRRRIHLGRLRDVDEVMWDTPPRLSWQLVGAYVEAAVHGRGIAVDDFAAMPLGERKGERALPRRGRAEDRKHAARRHMLSERHSRPTASAANETTTSGFRSNTCDRTVRYEA